MRAFTTGEIGRFQMEALTQTAVIKRVSSGSDPDARSTVDSSVRCSEPRWLDQEQKERSGMGTIARLLQVTTESPGAAIYPMRDRFVYNSIDYRIRAVLPVPATSATPLHYTLYIEDET